MKRYYIIDDTSTENGDVSVTLVDEGETEDMAIYDAMRFWQRLGYSDKLDRDAYYVIEAEASPRNFKKFMPGTERVVWECDFWEQIVDFVRDVFDNAIDPHEMTLAEAEADLAAFRADGWRVPRKLTAEQYAELFNEYLSGRGTY